MKRRLRILAVSCLAAWAFSARAWAASVAAARAGAARGLSVPAVAVRVGLDLPAEARMGGLGGFSGFARLPRAAVQVEALGAAELSQFLQAVGSQRAAAPFAAPPSLPASLVPGAHAPAAGRVSFQALDMDVPAGSRSSQELVPPSGGGGRFSALQRHSLRVAAKAAALDALLASDRSGADASAEGARLLGRRVMEAAADGLGRETPPGLERWGVGADQPSSPGRLRAARNDSNRLDAPSRRGQAATGVPVESGAFPRGVSRRSLGLQPSLARRQLHGEVALITLRVVGESLLLSASAVPARGMARRWAGEGARALAGSGASRRPRLRTLLMNGDRTDDASGSLPALRGAAAAGALSAQDEMVSFMQALGRDGGRQVLPVYRSRPDFSSPPARTAAPLLAAACLSFLALGLLLSLRDLPRGGGSV